MALTLVLVELTLWSDSHLRNVHSSIANNSELDYMKNDKVAFARILEEKY